MPNITLTSEVMMLGKARERERRELEDYYWTLTFGFAPHTSLSYDFMEYSKVAMNYFIGAFFVILKHEHNSCTQQECSSYTAQDHN